MVGFAIHVCFSVSISESQLRGIASQAQRLQNAVHAAEDVLQLSGESAKRPVRPSEF